MGSRFLLRFHNEVKVHPCDIQPRFLPWDREWETAWSHAKKQLMMTRSFVGKRHAWWDFPVWMLGICDGWQPLDRWGIDVIWKFKIHCQRQEMFVLMKAWFSGLEKSRETQFLQIWKPEESVQRVQRDKCIVPWSKGKVQYQSKSVLEFIFLSGRVLGVKAVLQTQNLYQWTP